jgi:osmoprotectant transport system permease protein
VILLAQLQIHQRGGAPDCVERNGICPRWIVDNLDRYTHPLLQQLELVLAAVAIGFAIAFSLGLLAHRHRVLVAPITQITGILYTLPSVAVFFLLLPVTGRGFDTALIALVAYTLLIIFRNVVTAGLRIAMTTTVGLASLAFLAGAGGLGDAIFNDRFFRSNVLVAGGLCVLLAVVLDLAVLAVQKALTPWTRAVS